MRATGYLNDNDIRTHLISTFMEKFKSQTDTLLVEEMGICRGQSRVDLAIINGVIHGIEIKSDLDSLDRLEKQIELYGKTLDKVTLYVGNKLIDTATEMIPEWWGVVLISKNSKGKIMLKNVRSAKLNRHLDPFEVLQFLWKEEAINLLSEIGVTGNFYHKSRDFIFEKIESHLSLKKIRDYTRSTLKSRENWKPVHSLA